MASATGFLFVDREQSYIENLLYIHGRSKPLPYDEPEFCEQTNLYSIAKQEFILLLYPILCKQKPLVLFREQGVKG